MNNNIKITIDTLINKAIEISKQHEYDYHIKDIYDLCCEFDYDYTEKLVQENELYIP